MSAWLKEPPCITVRSDQKPSEMHDAGTDNNSLKA